MRAFLFLVFICCTLKTNAQNYLITFAGTGASTIVNTVKVENLTEGSSLSLNGSDILRLTITTGIKSADNGQSSKLKIFPNPMNDNSILEVSAPVAGEAIFNVYNMIGKLVVQIPCFLENNQQEFRLSGLNRGLYLISVKGKTYQYSEKLLCIGKSDGAITIGKINNNQQVDVKPEKQYSKGTQATVDMEYTTGDRLKFTGVSGNYSTVKMDIPASDKTIIFNFIACTDGDNINYTVLELGTQVWMAENLKTAKYSNGELIGTTTPATLDISAESTPKYQWACGGDESNAAVYGRLYTRFVITDNRNVCPIGWHVPADAEWTTLFDYLITNSFGYGGSGNQIAKSMAATTDWINNGPVGTPGNDLKSNNSSGFSALPVGNRNNSTFSNNGPNGYWWSSAQSCRTISNHIGQTGTGSGGNYGYSLRCVMDN